MKNIYKTLFFLTFLLNANFLFSQIEFTPYFSISNNFTPTAVSIDDVNNDGLKDVVLGVATTNQNPNFCQILVFLQSNNGDLDSPIAYSYPDNFSTISSIDISDLNDDNLNDIVISYGTKIGIFFQNNLATLNTVIEINTNSYIYSLKTNDLNSDGLNDIVIGTGDEFLKIYYQNNSSVFTEISYPKPGYVFDDLEIGDLNNDLKPDIIFTSRYSNQVYIFYQNSNLQFNNFLLINVNVVNGVSIGDVNNDGLNDFVVTKNGNSPNSKIEIFIQNYLTNLMNPPIEIAAYDVPQPIEVSDLNNDGINEIVILHGGWMRVSVYEQSNFLYNQYSLYNIPYASQYNNQGFTIGDINNDGAKDLAIVDYNNGLVILYNSTALSTKGNSFDKKIIVFPNPIIDFFTINIDKIEESKYEIYDTKGKLLAQDQIVNLKPIKIDNFDSGLYFLVIKTKSTTETIKIIKQ